MFSQVILNAIEAMPDGGDLTISTSQKGQTIFFKAGDTGLGISPDTAVDLFKPLFTTKYVQTVPAG
jgi:signal transduction histidine kinase